MLKANATVIHLGNIDMVNDGSSPIRRPRIAVEYKENVDARAIDATVIQAEVRKHKIGSIQTTGTCSKIELNRNDVT